MATRSNNKQIKVVADTDFNSNKIINARISGSDNLITGVNKVDDVKVNNTSILQSRVANINFAENCNNIQTTVQEGSIYTDFKGIGIIKNSYKIGDPNTEIQQSDNTISFPESEHISTGTLIFKNGTLLNFSTDYTIIASNCINLIETPVTNDIISVINGLSILSKISNINDNRIVCEDFINDSTLVFKNGKLLSNVGDQKDYTITGNTITFTLNLNTSDIIVLIKSVTNSDTFSEQYGKFLEYEGPYDNLVFKNGNFLAKDIDYQVELLGTNHYRLNFITTLTTTDVVRLIYNELNSIYTLLGDKQNSLPTYQTGKVLGTDGKKLSWVTVQSGLPSQSGQSGKFLTTNGSTISWGLADALPSQSGQNGKFLTTNGTTASWAVIQSDNYMLKPTVITDADTTNLPLLGNTIYKWTTTLSFINLSSAEISNYETALYFTTGSSITFLDNSSLRWVNGVIPSLDVDTVYRITIKNGLAKLENFGNAIPSGYTVYDYINNTSSNYKTYIDTGLSIPDGFVMTTKIWVEGTSVGGQFNSIVFAENSASPYGCNGLRLSLRVASRKEFVLGLANTFAVTYDLNYQELYEIAISTISPYGSIMVNNTTIMSDKSAAAALTTKNIYLFANNARTVKDYYVGRLYRTKFYNSNNYLLRDYVPVKRNTDNKFGLYDIVTNTFSSSSGESEFSGGND